MTKPFFSIITCTYNSEKTLKKNIDSVLNQTFGNYEHIFIDGNSTDNTPRLIKEYQKQNPNKIKIFRYPPKGISDAMNHGILKSNGKYLIHLHGDDSFSSSTVLTTVRRFLINHHNLDWIYGKINTMDSDTNKKLGIFPGRKIFQIASPFLLKIFNFVPHQAVFIKNTVFQKHGLFSKQYKIAMDYEFWVRICNCTKWRFADIIVSNYGISTTSTSSKLSNRTKNILEYHQIHKNYLNPLMYFISELSLFVIEKLTKTYR